MSTRAKVLWVVFVVLLALAGGSDMQMAADRAAVQGVR